MHSGTLLPVLGHSMQACVTVTLRHILFEYFLVACD
jgi:hypothetical protein